MIGAPDLGPRHSPVHGPGAGPETLSGLPRAARQMARTRFTMNTETRCWCLLVGRSPPRASALSLKGALNGLHEC